MNSFFSMHDRRLYILIPVSMTFSAIEGHEITRQAEVLHSFVHKVLNRSEGKENQCSVMMYTGFKSNNLYFLRSLLLFILIVVQGS